MIRDCGVNDKLDCASDHLPIVTTLEYLITEPPRIVRRKYRDIDIKIFTSALQRGLPRGEHIESREDLDQVMNDITTAIQKAIEDTIPTVVICARSIPGFTDECREAIDEVKWAQRRWRSRPTESNLHELQQAKHHSKRNLPSKQRYTQRKSITGHR